MSHVGVFMLYLSLMATRAELLGNIQLQVTGGLLNDDGRFNSAQALFALDIETARAVYEYGVNLMEAREATTSFSWGSRNERSFDPALLGTVDVEIAQVSDRQYYEGELPQTPIALPDHFGITNVFVPHIRTGIPQVLQPATHATARSQANVLFSSPLWVRVGNKLHVYNFRGVSAPSSLKVTMIGGGLLTEGMDSETFMNGAYPLPKHLEAQVTARVVQTLRQQLGLPGDTFNDNKQQAVNPQTS